MIRTHCAALLLLATTAAAQSPAQSPSTAPAPPRMRFALLGGGPFTEADAFARLQQAVADANALDVDLAVVLAPPGDADDATWRATLAGLRMPALLPPGTPAAAGLAVVDAPHRRAACVDGHWFLALARPPAADDAPARAWLANALAKAAAAPAVFLLVPTPAWAGADAAAWQGWHAQLVAAGNVRAVVSGGGDGVRHDGARDGIAYLALPALGATLPTPAPEAGFLHAVHLASVRNGALRLAAMPLGAACAAERFDAATAATARQVARDLAIELDRASPAAGGDAVALDGRVDAVVVLRCRNPSAQAIELEVTPAADAGWTFSPDHQHVLLQPGAAATTTFAVHHEPTAPLPFALPRMLVKPDALPDGRRVPLAPVEFLFPLPPPEALGREPARANGVLMLDGDGSFLRTSAAQSPLGPDACTVEAFVCADGASGRQVLAQKGDAPQFALVVDGGQVAFEVAVGSGVAAARSAGDALPPGAWRHVAGVHDGKEVRLYLDGKLTATASAPGPRTVDKGPLLVGAALRAGAATDGFAGRLDELRLSRTARYAADFAVPTAAAADADTVLLLPCDADFGPWAIDRSGNGRHPRRFGAAFCTRGKR